MRTEILIDNESANAQQIGEYIIDCGQDMRWLLMIKTSGLDGTPKAYVEESSNGSDWVALDNNDCVEGVIDYFPVDDPLINIRDSYFMGKSIRLRFEPEDNTTGTIYAELIVKTKSN
jgi:hypothetical protein